MSDIFDQLKAPFPPERIHWRIGSKSRDGTKARLLAYLNARDVMERLDEVVGPENWSDSYTETPKRLICTLRVCFGRDEFDGHSRWIEKSDGAGDTNMEGEKGGLSDAFKRAAVKFGIGRYLYDTESPWVTLDERGNIPKDFDGKKYLKAPVDYMALVREHFDTIVAVKTHLANDEVEDARAAYKELPQNIQIALWAAPSKGGIWTTAERAAMKGTK